MIRLLHAVVFLLFAAGAEAAVVNPPSLSGPRIEASSVLVQNEVDFGLFTVESADVVFGGITLDFLSLTRFDDGTGFASAGLLDNSALLTGALLASLVTPDGLLFGFETDEDDFGIGPLFSVLLRAGADAFPSDPFGVDFTVADASAVVAAPIPLPAAAPLLLAGVAALMALRSRRRA